MGSEDIHHQQQINDHLEITPFDLSYINHAKSIADSYFKNSGFKEIVTSLVLKEDMYTDAKSLSSHSFQPLRLKSRDSFILRPEGILPLLMACIDHALYKKTKPYKLYTYGSYFEGDIVHESYRYVASIVGSATPIRDAEMILLSHLILVQFNLSQVTLHINSVGCSTCKVVYRKKLAEYIKDEINHVCGDCKKNITKKPFNILICKEDKCLKVANFAPQTVDYICLDCKSHFKSVLEFLDAVDISYTLNPKLIDTITLVTRTVFEFRSSQIGELVLSKGGRYDGIAQQLSKGKISYAVGSELYLNSIVRILKTKLKAIDAVKLEYIFIASIGDSGKKKALQIFSLLQKEGFKVKETFDKNNLKVQLNLAHKKDYAITIVVGQKEAIDNAVIVKDRNSANHEIVPTDRLVEVLKGRLAAIEY